MIEQLTYMLICAVAMCSVINLQAYRHRGANSLLWWSYTILTFGVGWELIDAYKSGPPGFPSSRWVLMPTLAFVLAVAAVEDWRDRVAVRRTIRAIDDDANGAKS